MKPVTIAWSNPDARCDVRCGEARELTQGSGTVRVCEVVR